MAQRIRDRLQRSTGPELYLSRLLNAPIVLAEGTEIARAQDFVVRFGAEPHPPVSGLVARVGRDAFYISASVAEEYAERGIRLSASTFDLRPFERRDGEVLLRRDILDKQLIDIDGRRVVRANDLLLAMVDRRYRLVGVDVSVTALWRRLGPQRMTANLRSREVIDWEEVESFATDVPMVRLRVSHQGISRLHPVEIAQILDDLSPRQGQEILEAMDDETAADVVEELHPNDAADLLERLDPERAADILEEMAPDDAADVLAEMEDDDSDALLDLMERDESEDVRALLDYAEAHDEDAAAGLLTTELVAIPPSGTAGAALSLLRSLEQVPDPLYHLHLVEALAGAPERRRLIGTVPVRALLLVDPATPLTAIAEEHLLTVKLDEPAREVAHTMAEYNLSTIPVVDDDGCLLGVIQIDDAIDALLPDLWTRRIANRLKGAIRG
jgi:magnesium transporter